MGDRATQATPRPATSPSPRATAHLQYDGGIDPLSLADRSWPLLHRLMGVHTCVYRLTGGLVGHRFLGSPPVLLLDHVGARSGTKRTTPLLYIDDPPNVVIVASKGGYPRNPAWYHNLRAHPDTEVQVGSQRRRVHARMATAAERKRLWPMAVSAYSGYTDYQQRTGREIPLVILEPRANSATRNGKPS